MLKRFNGLCIKYSRFLVVLEGYNDANWISDSDEKKSTSGMYSNLGVERLHGDQLGKQLS